MKKLFGAAAIALSGAILVAAPAKALTVMEDGDVFAVGCPGCETAFTGDVESLGGGGMWMVTFDSTPFETTGNAMATIGPNTAAAFSGLTMSWVSTMTGMVLSTSAISPIETTILTSFTSPDNLSQKLVIEWTGSQEGTGFDLEVNVAAIPLPASVLMLLAGLGGLGIVSRRRKAAAA